MKPFEIILHPNFGKESFKSITRENDNSWFFTVFEMIRDRGKLEAVLSPEIENFETYTGVFKFCFWKFGKWYEVVVDDCISEDQKLVTEINSECIMYFLLKKALFSFVNSKSILECIATLTGGIVCEYAFKRNEEEFSCLVSRGIKKNFFTFVMNIGGMYSIKKYCQTRNTNFFEIDGKWISYSDLVKEFNTSIFCFLPNSFLFAQIEGVWNGLSKCGECRKLTYICNNPQIFFDISNDVDKNMVIICLSQKVPLYRTGFYVLRVYEETLKLYIDYGVKPSEEVGEIVFESKYIEKSIHKTEILYLKNGRYCIIPTVFNSIAKYDFILRLFSESDINICTEKNDKINQQGLLVEN